jgi:uncharacterized membrane protein
MIFDLREFYSYNIEYLTGFWYYEGKLAAILFMLTAGISSTFSKNNLKRGSIVFGFGMLLTLVTYVYDPVGYIKFGILHFLGISMILYHLMKKLKSTYLFLIGTAALVLGNIFAKMLVDSPFLFMFGLLNRNFSSLDYYPLLPWFGVFIYGVIIGRFLYAKRKSLFPDAKHFDFLSYLGRHSLFIYLTHQPMLIALLFISHKLI